MSNPTWPSSLPVPLDENVSYGPKVDPILVTQTEGSVKVRRQFTAVIETLTCTLMLTQAQLDTFRNFHRNTLKYTMQFDWKDFRTGATATYVFTKTPTETIVSGVAKLRKVQVELMKMP